MGQRSQIYVFTEKGLQIANYYQWNYGTRMISRARYGIEWAKTNIDYSWHFERNKARGSGYEKFRRIWDVNFDYGDMVLSSCLIDEAIEESGYTNPHDLAEYVLNCDNNDGKLFVYINTNIKRIKYALTDKENNILTPAEYLKWDSPTWKRETDEVEFTENNIEYLNEFQMLTSEELQKLLDKAYQTFIPKI